MLPSMERTFRRWRPDVVVRDPCEYTYHDRRRSIRVPGRSSGHLIGTSRSCVVSRGRAPLEEHRKGLVEEVFASPYLTRFPASLDPSSFPTTARFREPSPSVPRPLPEWWHGSKAPLIYVTFGTVLGYMLMATDVYRSTLRAIDCLPVAPC